MVRSDAPAASDDAPAAPNPWTIHTARLKDIRQETGDIASYEVEFVDDDVARTFRFRPGQFNMLYLPGCGEAALSISSDPQRDTFVHTVRIAGTVTGALARRQVGDEVGIRGPFGSSWPIESCKHHDVVIAGGGIGLAPLRPLIYEIINHRSDYGKVAVLYGARSPSDLMYVKELDQWREADLQVDVTVDVGSANWSGHIGVVPALLNRLRLEPESTRVITCGPEIMMRFVCFEALSRRIDPNHIFLSMERNMGCAVGLCGKCQLGPTFVCKDGPVFAYKNMEPYLLLEDL